MESATIVTGNNIGHIAPIIGTDMATKKVEVSTETI